MNKAYLVTFGVTVRVVTRERGNPNGDSLEDVKAYNDVVSKACEVICQGTPPDFSENVATIEEDIECPYGTYSSEKT